VQIILAHENQAIFCQIEYRTWIHKEGKLILQGIKSHLHFCSLHNMLFLHRLLHHLRHLLLHRVMDLSGMKLCLKGLLAKCLHLPIVDEMITVLVKNETRVRGVHLTAIIEPEIGAVEMLQVAITLSTMPQEAEELELAPLGTLAKAALETSLVVVVVLPIEEIAVALVVVHNVGEHQVILDDKICHFRVAVTLFQLTNYSYELV